MKANSVRIGNLVYDTKGEVNAINLDGLKYLVNYGDTDICQVKSIPLTQSWIWLKFNFNLYPWGYVLHGILVRTDFTDKFWIELGNGKKIDMPYVHTLQNFFALAGHELELRDS